MNDINIKLKEFRKMKKMSQADVAYKIGITRPYFNKLERGKYSPKLSVFYKWCQILGCKLTVIIEV